MNMYVIVDDLLLTIHIDLVFVVINCMCMITLDTCKNYSINIDLSIE